MNVVRTEPLADTDDGRNVAETPGNLKRSTARGALISVIGQGAGFTLRMASMVVIARLVTPEHFGLVGMVTAFTGILSLFRDAGLAQATVQRETIDDGLVSTLFWVNLAFGVVLAVVAAAIAPVVATFYDDDRLTWITVALASGFVFNGALAQHRALLQRRMRFGVLVAIDTGALLLSISIGVWMAIAGMGYWALVGMAVTIPAGTLVGVLLATGWWPRRPGRLAEARSMLQYGGLVSVNGLVMYVAYNLDKVLLGRFWGAETLGLYGRAYQLINLPTDNLNVAIGWVMFPALSRVQSEPQRLRRYFLAGYGMYLSVVMPITLACAVFADDIVRVLLGRQWDSAVPIFRLLAPTILAFAVINPMGALMQATGRVMHSLQLAFVIAPAVILGYVLGLPHGAIGVAAGFSLAMLLLIVPSVLWAVRGTLISWRDLLRTITPPLMSTLIAGAVAVAVRDLLLETNALARLMLVTVVMFAVHAATLAFVFRQKNAYLEILKEFGLLRGRAVTGAGGG